MGICHIYVVGVSHKRPVVGLSVMLAETFASGAGYPLSLILFVGGTMLRPTDALPTYLRDYREMRHSHDHDLLGVFRAVRDLIGFQRVVYPGSYVHLTPSLVFPCVCYVDSVKGFGAAMQSGDLRVWLDAHKEYTEQVEVTAVEAAYDRIPSTLLAGFGLMISLNAGAISQECKPLLAAGAHLLANDGHYDAARAHVDADYTLVAALSADGAVETGEEALRGYFVSRQGQPLTHEMPVENAQRSPSKARYKMARTADVFLFRFK